MKYISFTFDSCDRRHKIYGGKFVPDGNIKAILLCVHGMNEHFGRYRELAIFLASQGFLVAGHDQLGHGRTAEQSSMDNGIVFGNAGKSKPHRMDNSDFGFICENDPATMLIRDVHKLRKRIEGEYPGKPVFLFGHSMGSFIVRNYLSMHGRALSGAILMGSGEIPSPVLYAGRGMLSLYALRYGWRYRSHLCTKIIMYHQVMSAPADERPTGWLSSDRELLKKVLNDPYVGHEFTVNGYYTLLTLIHRMTRKKALSGIPKSLPLFFLSGGEDPIGHSGRDILMEERLYKESGIQDIQIKVYPGDRHELYHEKDRFNVYSDIAAFMNRVLSGSQDS